MANSALAPRLKTPGVYIEEISTLPPSVAQVPTAIPVFIGYTEITETKKGESLLNKPTRIKSMLEYTNTFGGPAPETGIKVFIDTKPNPDPNGTPIPFVKKATNDTPSPYKMFYAMQWFYANGGGDCWIVSVGKYTETGDVTLGDSSDAANKPGLLVGLEETDKVDEITLFVFPDAHKLGAGDYYGLYKETMDKCAKLGDRFTIMDVKMAGNGTDGPVETMRNFSFGDVNTMKYGAAYYPDIETTLDYWYKDEFVSLDGGGNDFNGKKMSDLRPQDPKNLKPYYSAIYSQAKIAISDISLILSPSPGIAGIYASVDFARGVWKSPANVGLDYVVKPTVAITDSDQESLNVDVNAGKSINAIRSFTGRGPGIVWGARTLAGNDNEWRYISVRRFFNMVEESVKKATVQFVFEPNDKNTWVRVKSMIENFLILQWRAGALAGATPEHAFYVKVGLGETMTAVDILEGRMIVEIGMAAVRPAEFIILQFMHKMQES
jgi:hypothetical protein